MKVSRADREKIARKRLLSVLETHGAASTRTLEQKISDAGPTPLRVDPHILTGVRNELVKEETLKKIQKGGTFWYYRSDTPQETVETRLAEQLVAVKQFTDKNLALRIGQTLEIATFRALTQLPNAEFFGRFIDLDQHDDTTLYRKEEPPQHIGERSIPGGKNLDFILRSSSSGYLGIECKNVREWLYPDRQELLEFISKCLSLDCIPVLIGRRIPYVTFRLLSSCGVIIHQNYNQLLPASAQAVADVVKHKNMLGYHDIRTGNMPDARLQKFIVENLMGLAPEARSKFDEYCDLLEGFSNKELSYQEFAARVRRRESGQNEDHDWSDDPADFYSSR